MTTVDEQKKHPAYRYTKELVDVFEDSVVPSEPIALGMKAVMEAPLPDYLSIDQAVTTKMLFLMVVCQPRMGTLMDNVPGIRNMMLIASGER